MRHYLFDLDGTLVDTITLYGKAVLQSLHEIGIRATAAEFRDWYVRPLHLVQILGLHGESESHVPTLRLRRDQIYIDLLRTECAWLPGAEELLHMIEPPTAIVTTSWMTYVDAINERLDIKKYFNVIVTVDQTGDLSKPHPHPLLLAADSLHVDPKDCVYIGDQRFDVEAAKAAGMQAWLVRGEWTPEKIEGADRTFGSLTDVTAEVRRSAE